MRAASTAAILALSLAAQVFAAENPRGGKLVTFYTQARVDVDSEGRVVAVQPDPALPAAVGGAIQSSVSAWRFTPATKEGRAVSGVTFVQLSACAAPADGNYRLAVAYRGNGPAKPSPSGLLFPAREMRAQHSAKLQVDYSVLADGTAKIDAIRFLEGSKGADEAAFVASVEHWVAGFKLEPELVDGIPVATKMSFPVRFESGGTQYVTQMNESRRQYQKQVAARQVAEQSSCQAALAPSDNSTGQVALDSPFHLLPSG